MNKDLIEFTKKLLKAYNKEYRNKLIKLYPEAYKENPEAFPFADLNNIDTYIIKGDKEFLDWSYYLFLYQGNGDIKNLGDIPYEEYSKLKNFTSDFDFISNFINEKIGYEKTPYYTDASSIRTYLYGSYNYDTPEKYIEIQMENISNSMLRKLKDDGNQFINHIDKEASYYAKNAFRYAYSELDFTPIIEVVKDKDFEYALNESIACYDQSLYLAAVSTAGTTLENLIIKILESKGEYTDDNSTTELGELSGKLRRTGLINKRERKRIMLAASFRNLASHANKGRVTRQDAKLVYQEIFNLASKAFNI
jgi:hypothetical protein